MSRSVDLFIDSGITIAELAAKIKEITGLPFTEDSDSGGWSTRADDFQAVLIEHPYVDDGELLFSQYRYALSSRVGGDQRPQDSAATAMLRLVADQLQRQAGIPVLLVLDLQYRDRPAQPDPSGPPLSGDPSENPTAAAAPGQGGAPAGAPAGAAGQ